MQRHNLIPQNNRLSFRLAKFGEKTFLDQKLNNWFGYIFVSLIAVVFGYMLAKQTTLGFGLFGFVISLAVIVICLLSTETGLYINVFYSFFAFHFSRLLFNDTFPVGIASDVLILATFFSLFVRRVNLRQSINQFSRTPVVICILTLFFYTMLELFNPAAHSFDGWYQTFRKILASVLLLFIAYKVFTDYARIKRFIIVLFILASLCGLYGCIQEWHGIFDFELAWVTADKNRFDLIFIEGDFRKFSTMSDPTAYSIVMGACAVFFIIIAWNQKKFLYKSILIIGIMFMLLGIAYSGTRTANAMVVAGIFMYILLTFHKKSTRIFAAVIGFLLMVIIHAPIYSNPTINRIRTTFTANKDESYKYREANRAFIQPYIWAHPIGGGLGTVGAGGMRFNPGHYLAGFPPDSGYLKKALETGWLGLAIMLILYFSVLKYGITGYFKSKNEKYKLLFGASVASMFSFYIAEFAQDAIGQITDIVVYYPIIAIILKLNELNRSDQSSLSEKTLSES